MNSPFNLSRKYNTIAAIIGGALVVAILISMALIRPAWGKLKQLGTEVPVEQQKRDAAESQLTGLEKAKTYLNDEKEQVDQVNIAVPIEPQVPQILLILEQLAKDNRVRLTTFTPQVATGAVAQSGQAATPTTPSAGSTGGSPSSTSATGGQSLEVTANFQGSYGSLINFFYTLERSLRLIDVKSITVSGAQSTDGASTGNLTGAITFTAYYKTVDGGPQAATGGTK